MKGIMNNTSGIIKAAACMLLTTYQYDWQNSDNSARLHIRHDGTA